MAIFNKSEQPVEIKPRSTETTIISDNTRVKGSITSSCPVQINGTHEGAIDAQGTVIIGRSGKIDGELSANRLTVTGLFHGTADCEQVEIRAGGTFRGKVISNNLTIDQNCSFEGESVKKSKHMKVAKSTSAKSQAPLPDSLQAS